MARHQVLALVNLIAVSMISCRTADISSTSAAGRAQEVDPSPIEAAIDEKPIIVLVSASIKDGTETRFLDALPEIMAGTRSENGNLGYYPHQSLVDANAFTFLEKWDNSDALMAHRGQPHTKAFFDRIGAFLAAPPAGESFKSVMGTDPRVKPTNPDSDFLFVFSTIQIREGADRTACLAAFSNLVRKSRKEANNLGFEVYQSQVDENKYVIYEIWTDAKAEWIHGDGDSNEEFLTAIKEFLAVSPVAKSFRVVAISP
jgi:quinol monooxygenase YgiN